MTQLARIATRLYNRPLLLLPSAAEVVASVLASRTGAEPMIDPIEFAAFVDREMQARGGGPEASRFAGRNNGPDGSFKPYYRLDEGVAVITVVGELVNRGAWVGANSGLVSFEAIQAQLRAAQRDGDVRAIIIDMQSPGGEAVGTMETAAVVREVAADKPVIGVVNGMAASAGYGSICGSTEIVTTATGLSGSIGVIMLHIDQSKRLEMTGVKPTLIFAGAHKADGNSFGPLPAEVAADLQAEVDAFYELFVECVASGRPGLTAEQIRATEARTFIGQAAVDAGLADRVGTFEGVLADLKAGRYGRTAQRTSPRGTSMSTTTTTQPAASIAGELLNGAAAAITGAPEAAASVQAVAEATKKAAADATARIKAITTCDEASGREPLASHLAFNTNMSAEDAKATLAAASKSAAADPLITAMNGLQQPNLGSGNPAPQATETAMAADDIYAARRASAGVKR